MFCDCTIPCNACGCSEVEVISLADRDGRYLRTVICRKCGLVWTDPRPSEDEIRDFYAREYRLKYKGAYQPKLKHVYRAIQVGMTRFYSLQALLSQANKILDVGSGGGEFVYLLRALGYDARGIEPNEGYALYARNELGLPIEVGFLKELNSRGEVFDLITLFHVLEHLEDPCGTLLHLRHLLGTEGRLVIEVPNIESTSQAPNHRFHFAHLYNFNSATLQAVSQLAGYEVEATLYSAGDENITVYWLFVYSSG